MNSDERRESLAASSPSTFALLENLRLATEIAYERHITLSQEHGQAWHIYEESKCSPAGDYEKARRNLKAAQRAAIDSLNAYKRERATYENVARILMDPED